MNLLGEYLNPIFDLLRAGVYAVGVLIVAWGVAEAAIRFVRLRTVEHSSGLFFQASSIRERLAVHLLLALDVFIGADLIATVLHPDWASVGVLAAIVAIRVVLSFVLSYEMRDVHRFITENEGSGEQGEGR